MSNNSITKYTNTKQHLLNTIKLKLNADISRSKPVILVEGNDDSKFIKTFIDDECCIFESYSGKEGVKEILEDSKLKKDKRVIGICDKDYDDICEIKNNKLFYYDYCCLEMMLIANNNLNKRICDEFYEGNRTATEVRLELLKKLFCISNLRNFNSKNLKEYKYEDGINFKGIRFCNTLNKNQNFCADLFYKELIKINPPIHKSYIDENFKNIKPLSDTLDYYLNITNGHDYIFCFQTLCNHNKKSHIKINSIASCLRVGFSFKKFKETNLYTSLKDYEQNKDIIILKEA